MKRTFDEINEKIKKKKAVVITAEEMTALVKSDGAKKAASKIDVVTTGTFGCMCSSGALFNIHHTTPKMKIQKAWLGGVPAYGGVAAADFYLGSTELPEDDPLNKVFPGRFRYGGAHAIEDLVGGKEIPFRAVAYGTDCYPGKYHEQRIRLSDFRSAMLLNPRNAYQNYNVGVNRSSSRPIYTYMGVLRPGIANAAYSSAGMLSPLLNDPYYRTIGVGTRIFLGGGTGYVFYQGTQHSPDEERSENGVPLGGAGTVAVVGDLKKMNSSFLRGASLTGYGVSLAVGLGIPIPILDEDMAAFTGVADEDVKAPVVDYSEDYGNNTGEPLAWVSYAELRSGKIELGGKTVKASPLSSLHKAREIAGTLKKWIEEGTFTLGEPVETLPGPEPDVKMEK